MRETTWRSWKTALIALPALLPGALWATGAQAADPKRGGVAIFSISDDPTGINRNISSNNTDGLVACIIYQGLTRIDAKGAVQPLLAKSWTVSADGKTYTFQLNKADWQDGKPFTSDDVKYTLIEVSGKYSAIFSGAMSSIDGIDTPAPDQVVIRLKAPYGPLLNSLACSQGGGILPAHVFRGADVLKNPAIQKPVGLGPFLLEQWNRGSDLRLVRNPHYWEPGKPYLDGVIARIIPQPASRTQALMAGEIDYVPYLYFPTTDYPAVRANPRLVMPPSHSFPAVDLLFFNVTRKPFDDVRVRQALMYATDRDLLIELAYQGLGTPATMPFTNRDPWAKASDVDFRKMYPYDPAKAAALLDEAGLKPNANGVRLVMNDVIPISNRDGQLVSQVLKNMWAKVGVEVNTETADTTVVTKRVFIDRDYDSALNFYTSFGDPALGMARIFVTSSLNKPFGNGSGYSNPEIDKMFLEAQNAPDEAARANIYKAIVARLAVDLPVLTLRENQFFDGFSKDLKGMEGEHFLPTYRDAWLDR